MIIKVESKSMWNTTSVQKITILLSAVMFGRFTVIVDMVDIAEQVKLCSNKI